ncbi:helix-turn-helix domain-containing protein [Enterococcus sp. AZ196]|uniref:helix-turn-helix domain-containing protein n=1 Tax=Enterococcus sp. AZ196 TaxID=2774659 RepID=UPI003D2C0CC0
MPKQIYDYTSILNNFSLNMKSERIKKKMTQKELAKFVGVTKQTILNYENQKTIPTSSVMESIALALGTSLEALIGDDDENQKRIRIAERIEEMDTNPHFERLVLEEELLEEIYELAKLKRNIEEKNMSEQELDELIGGRLNKSKDEKIHLLLTERESKIQNSIKNLEKFYKKNVEDIIYRFDV